jgi:A/G-specific adenine glycosylase
LGYYRRAQQLHRAAQVVVERHGGAIPQDARQLLRLPGIGRYTAGAILSIAHDLPEPILEANSIRVLCRLTAWAGQPGLAESRRYLWDLAGRLVQGRHAGRFNQALMELGSQVCLIAHPSCGKCPVAASCASRRRGLAEQIPSSGPPKRWESVHEAAVVVVRGGRVLARRCQDGERYSGMWDFPRFRLAGTAAPTTSAVRTALRRCAGVLVRDVRHLTTWAHSVTRFRITLEVYQAWVDSKAAASTGVDGFRWLKPSELAALPLSATGRRISRRLEADAAMGGTIGHRAARFSSGAPPRTMKGRHATRGKKLQP